MKKVELVGRVFGIWAFFELGLTPVVAFALSGMLGLRFGPTSAIYGLLVLARLPLWWWLTSRLFGPTETLQRRADRGRMPSESALCAADARLQAAPRAMSFATFFSATVAILGTVGVHVAFVAPMDLRSLHVPVLAALTATAALSPIVLNAPLFAWVSSEASGRNYLLARTLHVDLERSEHPVANRLVVVGLVLCLVPSLALISAALIAQSQAAYTEAELSSRALAAELRYAASTGDPDPFAALASRIPAERATVCLTEGTPARLRCAGAATPAWVDADLLGKAAAGSVEPPDRTSSMRALRLADGRVAAAVVRMESVERGFVIVMTSVLAALAVVGGLAAWLLSRTLSGPLQRVAELIGRAAGKGDLSAISALPVAQLDEVGQVTHHLNDLLDSMRAITQAAAAIGAGDLAVKVGGEGELPEAFRRMAGQLRDVVTEVQSSSTELASAATEIFAASQEQEAASTSHAAGMTEITETMSSLSASATHVATAVRGVLENAEQTLQNTDHMVARINELTGRANRIGEILEAIREIANRTDLLALNGSLEATRAGDAGVGFSLVASEMRRLSERVTASVASIKSLVADIGESGASTVVATEESRKLADSTTQAARRITMVTQQQQTSTDQVTQNVRAVAEVVQQSAAATTQTRASAEGLKGQADRLTRLVGRFQLA